MKTLSKILMFAAVCGLALTSCGKNDDANKTTGNLYYSPKFGPLVKSKKVIKLTNKTRIQGDGKQTKIQFGIQGEGSLGGLEGERDFGGVIAPL
jgi:uncharacterized lipoprotein YehR (DUF1307 family)